MITGKSNDGTSLWSMAALDLPKRLVMVEMTVSCGYYSRLIPAVRKITGRSSKKYEYSQTVWLLNEMERKACHWPTLIFPKKKKHQMWSSGLNDSKNKDRHIRTLWIWRDIKRRQRWLRPWQQRRRRLCHTHYTRVKFFSSYMLGSCGQSAY